MQTARKPDRQTDGQKGRHIHSQEARQAGWLAGRQAYRQTDRQTVRQAVIHTSVYIKP